MDNNYNENQESNFLLFKTVDIKRHDGALYIRRLIIIRCFLGSIMLHKIYLTDSDCMHDHPWKFWSIILKGGYHEHTPEGVKYYKSGSFLFRPADWVHRLEVDKPVTTLVITGVKKRSWGFHTPLGFIGWRNYNATGTCE